VTGPDFTRRDVRFDPFPHLRATDVLAEGMAAEMLDWLDGAAPWSLTHASFYDQHEFSMLSADLPDAVEPLVSDLFVSSIAQELQASLGAGPLELVDANVHRLVSGMTIRLHNDFLGKNEESHRMLIQLNRGWSTTQGGLLMLFGEDDPESLRDIVLPTHRTGFGFEISRHSHHAVSTVHAGVRDTLVYTYRRKP
jgi:Rps23 Pro-64 3,4-dihydroxylase Tpa1-like proline 4-hydroxylase